MSADQGGAPVKRSLVLAGGGAKIGWAPVALQVLMDEADIKFDHIDAPSGSVFNLEMLLSGRSATFIAEAWGTCPRASSCCSIALGST